MKTSHIVFLGFIGLLIVMLTSMANAQSYDSAMDRAQRAIEHNQQMIMEQQRIDNERTQAIRQRYDNSMNDYYQRQMLNETQSQTRELRRLNRGY